MNRDEWLAFITDPMRGGRYLFARGETTYTENADAGSSLPELFDGLGKKTADPRLLVALHYLNCPALKGFVHREARGLARVALHSSVRHRLVSAGAIRGKINWQRTLVGQRASPLAVKQYHLNVPRRTSDLPENRLLKLFLVEVIRLASFAREHIASGLLARELAGTFESAQVALREPHIRDLPTARGSTTLMRQRARRNRDYRYHRLADLHEELERVVSYSHFGSVLSLLRRGWFEPVKDDDLFELYLLLLLLDVVETECGIGPAKKYALIRVGRGAVAEFEKAGTEVKVYFDQGPSAFAKPNSEYLRVARAYGMSVAERRPDISVVVEGPRSTAVLFVEAKESSDDKYERDSVYKALGYLLDFASLWPAGPGTVPRVAVMYPQMAPPRTGFNELNEPLVLLGADSRDRMAAIVKAVIRSTM